jgi:hypothetical protein
MNVSTNGRVVLAATRELSRKWQQTKQHWRDAKSDEFEREYLADLFSDVDRAIPILEELDKLISTVRRECE